MRRASKRWSRRPAAGGWSTPIGPKRLKWVQAPTASLEHYVFPELIAHPCTLTNMRGLFSDVIADHVFGYVLCFARNFHTYVRNQIARRWAPVGGEDTQPHEAWQ